MNNIIKKPFTNFTLDEDKIERDTKVLAVRLNREELLKLQEDMKFLQQPKDSTALKTLAEIGSYVIHDPKTTFILDTLFKNKKNNQRSGQSEF